jgi:hypothetical protein
MRTLIAGVTISLVLAACTKSAETNSGTASPQSPAHTQGQAPGRVDGTINGGGGIGIRCHGKLEMLDLFEARQNKLTPLTSPANEQEAADMLARRFAKHFWNPDTIPLEKMTPELKADVVLPIMQGRPFYNAGTKKNENVKFVDHLSLSEDLGHFTLPAGCQLEQVAYFQDMTTELSIVQKKWDELDWLSRSVLVAHEMMYLLDRREGIENLRQGDGKHTAEATRHFVGMLLSEQGVPARIDGLPGNDKIAACGTQGVGDDKFTYGYAFDRAPGKVTFEFNVIHGQESFYQMRVDFGSGSLAALKDKTAVYDLQGMVNLTGSDRQSGLGVHVVKTKDMEYPTIQLIDFATGLLDAAKMPQTFDCLRTF